MQTYTHAGMSVAILSAIEVCHPGGSLLAYGAVVVGSTMPDLGLATAMILERLSAKFKVLWLGIKYHHVAHSFLVQVPILTLALLYLGSPLQNPVSGLCVGMLSHLLVDQQTHNSEKWLRTDVSFLWGLQWLTKVKLGKYGLFEYRIVPGKLWPVKHFELYTLMASSTVALVAWLLLLM